jgi:hypothetical protein
MARRRRDSEALKQQRLARQAEHERVTGGSDDGAGGGHGGSGPDLAHVHGLGVNPKDATLYIATHTGLLRAPEGKRTATRVGDSRQDVMGFSVVGPDRFLGSGHPEPGRDAPPNLGLIRSDDAGRSWRPVSLLGEADFHVLRSNGKTVYGFNGLKGALMVSRDGGRHWQEHEPPGPMLDLAIDPEDSARVVAATERGLVSSSDWGGGWRALAEGRIGYLAWPESERLYLIDGTGRVALSGDGGQDWREMGSIDAQPAAFAASGDDLYAALLDGTVKRSSDDGASWSVRAAP